MPTHLAVTALTVATLASVGGCIEQSSDQSSLGLAGVTDAGVILEHYDEWSGWTTLSSTVWRVDTATGEAKLTGTARPRYDLQAAGDFHVAEYPTDSGSAVVAVRISTGEEITIIERDVTLGGRYDPVFALDGTNVVARTNGRLLVYDLDQRTSHMIPLSAVITRILTAGDGYALVERRHVHSNDILLVELSTGDVIELPSVPENRQAYFASAVIADGRLITSGWRYDGNNQIGHEVLELDITSRTWTTLAYYANAWADGLASPTGSAKEVRLAPPPSRWIVIEGASAAHVLVRFVDTWQGTQLELLDRATGQRTVIARQAGALATHLCGLLHDGRVYWIDDANRTLTIHNTASGEQDVIPLDAPLRQRG